MIKYDVFVSGIGAKMTRSMKTFDDQEFVKLNIQMNILKVIFPMSIGKCY